MRKIYPMPGFVEADTEILLASRNFVYMETYTITLVDGTWSSYYTTAQKTQTVMPIEGVTAQPFIGGGVQFSGIKFKTGLGVEVDEQTLQIDYRLTDLLQGISFPQALRLGRLDGARVMRDRYFAANWGSPWVGACRLFAGNVSTMDSIGRSSATLKVKSDLNRLNVQMPRDLYSPQCRWTLFDPGCGLNKDDYETTAACGTGSTSSIINWAGADADEYTMGMIYLTGGDSVTRVRTVRKATGTQLLLSYPLDFVPSTTDFFTAFPGCVRTLDRCGEFNNKPQFRGYPFVPVAETAL